MTLTITNATKEPGIRLSRLRSVETVEVMASDLEYLDGIVARQQLFEGVSQWFERINKYTRERNLALEHYIISSGNEEMIAATSIAAHFRKIFASRYEYNEAGEAIWPAVAINYTTKTQYLFRINKGVLNYWDDKKLNRWVPMDERPLPFAPNDLHWRRGHRHSRNENDADHGRNFGCSVRSGQVEQSGSQR